MVLDLYLGVLELLQKVPFAPQFPGVSKRQARRSAAIAIHSGIVTVIQFGTYRRFVDASYHPDARYIAAFPFVAVFVTDWYLIAKLGGRSLSKPLQYASLVLYAVFIFLSFSGWRLPV